MKVRGFIVLLGAIALITFSCKKDISPTVTFTVQDTVGNLLEMAKVFTHPCFDAGCDTTRINESFIKEGVTNANGQVTFEYPYSAIIDVIANWTDCDTSASDTSSAWCIYVGRTVARFESKREKSGTSNDYNVKVIVREER